MPYLDAVDRTFTPFASHPAVATARALRRSINGGVRHGTNDWLVARKQGDTCIVLGSGDLALPGD